MLSCDVLCCAVLCCAVLCGAVHQHFTAGLQRKSATYLRLHRSELHLRCQKVNGTKYLATAIAIVPHDCSALHS